MVGVDGTMVSWQFDKCMSFGLICSRGEANTSLLVIWIKGSAA